MESRCLLAKCLAAAAILVAAGDSAHAQAPLPSAGIQTSSAHVHWPDAPQPLPFPDAQSDPASAAEQDEQPTGQPRPAQKSSERETAKAQIKQQEKQRLLGIVPMFNTSYVSDAVSLTAGEKMKLAFRSAIDPVSFAAPALVAGFGELGGPDNNNGFGWGAEGYMKKWGAAYLDAFDSKMIGGGILPALLRQDPRYFRRGDGSTTRRTLYAFSTVVICKHDHTGRWEPNYSKVGGNFAAGAISNLYYPSKSDRTEWEQTYTSALIVTATGAVAAVFQEFWPDISRKLFKKDPTRGLDDQARAGDAAANAAPRQNKTLQPHPPAPE
jgi:hypothetical protein